MLKVAQFALGKECVEVPVMQM
uniref:Uncharacterized protein n=1 Tax=Anguilla anguilla TaxID=7936 RepID=A0A0E9UK53_ANGAN